MKKDYKFTTIQIKDLGFVQGKRMMAELQD